MSSDDPEPSNDVAATKTDRRSSTPPAASEFRTSIAGPEQLPSALGLAAERLGAELGLPVWFLVQTGPGMGEMSLLGFGLRKAFSRARGQMREDGKVALIIDSPGGIAECAFQVARMLQRHAGGFTAVVPRYAKSAATLLCLGADEIIMGEDAELGPLDAQIYDPEREEPASALDEVQALERLHSVALAQLDETMMMLSMRTPKKTDTLLPIACHFATEMMVPLLDQVDTVHYARQARVLKVAEDYAVRLLRPHLGDEMAKSSASQLVNGYPEHGFVIERDEAREELLLPVEVPSDEVDEIMRELHDILDTSPTPLIAHGKLEKTTP